MSGDPVRGEVKDYIHRPVVIHRPVGEVVTGEVGEDYIYHLDLAVEQVQNLTDPQAVLLGQARRPRRRKKKKEDQPQPQAFSRAIELDEDE